MPRKIANVLETGTANAASKPARKAREVKPLSVEKRVVAMVKIGDEPEKEMEITVNSLDFPDEAKAKAALKNAGPGLYRIIQVRKTYNVKTVQAVELEAM